MLQKNSKPPQIEVALCDCSNIYFLKHNHTIFPKQKKYYKKHVNPITDNKYYKKSPGIKIPEL